MFELNDYNTIIYGCLLGWLLCLGWADPLPSFIIACTACSIGLLYRFIKNTFFWEE